MSADYPDRSRWERIRDEKRRLSLLRPRVIWQSWIGRAYHLPYRSPGPAAVRRQKRAKRVAARARRTAAWSRAHP